MRLLNKNTTGLDSYNLLHLDILKFENFQVNAL